MNAPAFRRSGNSPFTVIPATRPVVRHFRKGCPASPLRTALHYLNAQVEISTSPTFTSRTSVTVSPVLLTFEVMTHRTYR